MNHKRTLSLLAALMLLSFLPAFGASGMATAQGKVVDPEGKPIPGVSLTFRNDADKETEYKIETSKKGRFYLGNLLYYPLSQTWRLTVEAEGYVPTHISVESKTQTAVLDKFESDIQPGQKLPRMTIGGFGRARIDLVLTPADQVAAAPVRPAGEARVVESAPPAPSADPWDAAVRAAAAGDLEGSVNSFERAVQKKPDDAARRIAFAKVLYQLKRHGEAAKQAVRAIELTPDSLDAQMVMYSVHMATDNPEGAREVLEAARKIAPDDLRVLGQVAFLADQSGDAQAAIAANETITTLAPNNVDAWVALGDLYAQSGQTDKSRMAFDRVVELDPQNAYQVFYNIGALIMNRSNVTEADTRKAVEAFRRAVEIKPDYAQAHQQLAFALLGAGDMKGAAASLERYVELRPDADDMKALLDGLRQ